MVVLKGLGVARTNCATSQHGHGPSHRHCWISPLAAGGLITALVGWTALLLAVDGIKKELPGGGNCLHYNARLR